MSDNVNDLMEWLMGGEKVDTTLLDAKKARKESSHFQCALPDWTGQGGMVHFWQNADGSFESLDSRIIDQLKR
jgi:hypothetical protein